PPPYHGRARRRTSGPGGHRLPAAAGRRQVALSGLLVPPAARAGASAHHGAREPALMATVETTDVVVIGSGFGGAIPAYYLSAAGARVVILERGPRLATEDFTQDLRLDTYTRIVDLINGTGMNVVAGNCVGGGSVVYFAASLRAPSFVFERQGTLGHRLWPASITRRALDRYYHRVERVLPVAQQDWDEISYAGGLWAAACANAGHTCNPLPVAVDLRQCTSCNWMLNGCTFGAKR